MDEFMKLVKSCTEQGQCIAQQMVARGVVEALYLYFEPSQPGKTGALFLVPDSAPVPRGAKLATGEGLRGNVPYSAYFQWIYERARSLPVLAY
jgi:hypothetical protein